MLGGGKDTNLGMNTDSELQGLELDTAKLFF